MMNENLTKTSEMKRMSVIDWLNSWKENNNEITVEKVKQVSSSTVKKMVNDWWILNNSYQTELSCFDYVFIYSKRYGLDMRAISKVLYGEEKPKEIWEIVKEMVLNTEMPTKPHLKMNYLNEIADGWCDILMSEFEVDFTKI